MERRPITRAASAAARIARLGAERGDRELLRVLDDDFARSAAAAGSWLVCRPGCDACCHGPFPITPLDVERLGRGLDRLSAADPHRAEALRERARHAVERLNDDYPGEPATGRLTTHDTERLDAFLERHAALPCPALDPASGRCELYDWRPVSCRTYGPPVRFAGEDVPPCDLCFDGADAATIERCRVEPDADGLEQALLTLHGVGPQDEWETLIAWALAR